MSSGTNSERITQNNTKISTNNTAIDNFKTAIENLPSREPEINDFAELFSNYKGKIKSLTNK